MKQEYNRLLEKAVPRMSDDELLGAVLSRREGNTMKNNENKSKKRFSKAVVIPLAAALAVGATAVGAVAVYNRNVNEEYARVLDQGEWQRQDLVDKEGNEVDQNLQAVNNGLYEMLNIELNKTFECDGYTLEFHGAMCDGESMLIFYTATFDDGQEFYPNDSLYLNPKDWYFGSEGVKRDGRGINGVLEKIDGKYVFNGCIDLCGIETVTEDVLSIHFTEFTGSVSKIGEDVVRFDVDVTLDIPLPDDMDKFNKTVDVQSAPHIDIGNWGDWDVNSVKATPLTITFNMSTDHETPLPRVIKDFWPVFPEIVTFKDGSVLDLTNQIGGAGIDEENRTFVMETRLDYPIDVAEIATIQIAGAVIDMDGNAAAVEIPEVYEKYDENGHLVVR